MIGTFRVVVTDKHENETIITHAVESYIKAKKILIQEIKLESCQFAQVIDNLDGDIVYQRHGEFAEF